jgi:hypothetical protein
MTGRGRLGRRPRSSRSKHTNALACRMASPSWHRSIEANPADVYRQVSR